MQRNISIKTRLTLDEQSHQSSVVDTLVSLIERNRFLRGLGFRFGAPFKVAGNPIKHSQCPLSVGVMRGEFYPAAARLHRLIWTFGAALR